MSKLEILALSGSHRHGSFNTALLDNAKRLAPKGVEIKIYEGLDKLPFYSEELDGDSIHPEAKRLREAIASADGILLAVPEYNFSMTALLKNALDWSSRPAGRHVFVGKPTAIVGASSSILGSIRAQLHTREVLHALQADVVSRPEVLVTQAATKFEDGALKDETARLFLVQVLDNLVAKINTSELIKTASQEKAS